MSDVFTHARSATLGAFLFLAFVLTGSGYIIWAKAVTLGLSPYVVTGVPLGLMLAYATLLLLARYFRLRDDQSGDNLYYLGFLYTLTSLGVSLWLFSVNDGGVAIVTNFGIAIATTILGIALRVVFNQMRQDPIEVESIARLELADAARNVRQELDSAAFEFASFRRAMAQMLEEGLQEQRGHAERLAKKIFETLGEIPARTAEPLAEASKRSRDQIQELAAALIERLKETGATLTRQEESLASTAAGVSASLEELTNRLKTMQTPDHVIEVKLQPFIQGFTKAVNNHAKATDDQMAELKSIIGKFDQSLRALADYMATAEKKRTADQEAARAAAARTYEETAETRRLLAALAERLEENPAPPPQPAGPPRPWPFFRSGRS